MKFNKKNIYITLFGILYGGVALVSLIHAVSFFALANLLWLAILLAVIFEIGQSAVLFSILTSSTGKSKVMPWTLMCILTAVQILGNVFSSYKYIVSNSPENLRFFKEPVFIWTDIPDAQATVIITYIVGGILPLVALAMSAMVTNYLEDEKDKNNEEQKEQTFLNTEENTLINQNSILQMEKQGLQESLDNKNKELEQLKEELKSKQELINSQKQEIDILDNENQELVKEKFDKEPKEDKYLEKHNSLEEYDNKGEIREDDLEEDEQTNEERIEGDERKENESDNIKSESSEKITNDKDEQSEDKLDNEGQRPLETTNKQTERTISKAPQSNNKEQIKEEDLEPYKIVAEDSEDIDKNMIIADALMGGNILNKKKKDSHFINNNSKRD